MKRLFRLALTLAVILTGSSEAFSCSCADPGVREKFRAADSVFVGTLIEMTPTNPTEDFPLAANAVKFKVGKRWKGARQSEITAIANYDQPGWCGDLNLTVGERYLIYAGRVKGRLLIYTDCGPNRNVKNAADDMKHLNGFWFRFFARLYPYPVL
jgi:hypothetical protein